MNTRQIEGFSGPQPAIAEAGADNAPIGIDLLEDAQWNPKAAIKDQEAVDDGNDSLWSGHCRSVHRFLVYLARVIFRFKDGGCLNHSERLEKSSSLVGWAAKAPSAILADTAIVNAPVATAVAERAGYEHAFNEPILIYHNGLSGKSLTIKNLFHGNLRLTANSRDGLISCQVVPGYSKCDLLGPLP
jgi:hypothetical protein